MLKNDKQDCDNNPEYVDNPSRIKDLEADKSLHNNCPKNEIVEDVVCIYYKFSKSCSFFLLDRDVLGDKVSDIVHEASFIRPLF